MEYTPTTEEVRGQWLDEWDYYFDQPHDDARTDERGQQFDRWLAEVARTAKEEAWDEGFKQGGPMHDVNYDDPDAHTRNPYAKEQA